MRYATGAQNIVLTSVSDIIAKINSISVRLSDDYTESLRIIKTAICRLQRALADGRSREDFVLCVCNDRVSRMTRELLSGKRRFR